MCGIGHLKYYAGLILLTLLAGVGLSSLIWHRQIAIDVSKGSSNDDNSSQDNSEDLSQINVVTWNMAAVNNNPFEYWLTMENEPIYKEVMNAVDEFITNPTQNQTDTTVSDIISPSMFEELYSRIANAKSNNDDPQLQAMREFWDDDYKHRKIVTEFLRDVEFGKKRLISMPDRITNTIRNSVEGFDASSGIHVQQVMRPSVISCFMGEEGSGAFTLRSVDEWWPLWLDYIFKQEVKQEFSTEKQAKNENEEKEYSYSYNYYYDDRANVAMSEKKTVNREDNIFDDDDDDDDDSDKNENTYYSTTGSSESPIDYADADSNSNDIEQGTELVYDMIPPINRDKYPALTDKEAKASVPLEILCLAIFDAIWIYIMNTQLSIIDKGNKLSVAEVWQPLRAEICDSMNFRKTDRQVEILQQTYDDADVMFLQEGSSALRRYLENVQSDRALSRSDKSSVFSPNRLQKQAWQHSLLDRYELVAASDISNERDQISYVLLSKEKFDSTRIREVTSEVVHRYESTHAAGTKGIKLGIDPGDLVVVTAQVDTDGKGNLPAFQTTYVLASYHGDTNGINTRSVIEAVHDYANSLRATLVNSAKAVLLFGLDANSYSIPDSEHLGVEELGEIIRDFNLESNWGQHPSPTEYTTYNARTYLQPQLNKAARLADEADKWDRNLKDFILFFKSDFSLNFNSKDNTGSGLYVEDMVFPTPMFPSDHGIVAASLKLLTAPTAIKAEGSFKKLRSPIM